MDIQDKANALIDETSPYLQQHAYNPVHWYPWSEQALKLAKDNDKPILLSIGYSACHWCHVMAHESFEDDDTAEVMNKYFINIKVDREERPDLDKIYQTAQQLLTERSGGWPLTMILNPDDHVPFYGGTYFPPEARHGLPGFQDLLRRVIEFYQNDKAAINKQNIAVKDALIKIQQTPNILPESIDSAPVSLGIQEMMNYFDPNYGGFSGAPKFPQTPSIEFLMCAKSHVSPELSKSATDNMELTLTRMGQGGIYDQLGGGFCRYSVDKFWLIPHFEKMLYDNGPLLYNYSQAWKLTDHMFYKQIANDTANWIIRDMQSPEGGYYSSLDADSEGKEGKFYVWIQEEIKQLLDEQEFILFAEFYGLNKTANFEGQWHLHIASTFDELIKVSDLGHQQIIQLLTSAKKKLLNTRNLRVWPGRDEKILTSWNALAIKGMAIASLRLDDEIYIESANRSLTFIHETMWNQNRLSASYKDGKSHLNAYLDDYAYLIDALLTVLSVKWDTKWMNFTLELATVLMEQFYDKENGGFYFTSHDHEALLQRRRDFMDDATPSGNGIAARVLLQLSHLTGQQDYRDAAEKTFKATWHSLVKIPHAHASLLQAVCDYNYPPRQVILRGKLDEISKWKKECYEATTDIHTCIYAIPDNENVLPGLLAERKPQKKLSVAYICEGFVCREPITNLNQLISDLKN